MLNLCKNLDKKNTAYANTYRKRFRVENFHKSIDF